MNPGSEITLKKEVFIPEHLRYKGSTRYDIILKHAKHNLPLDYFSNYGVSELEKISEIQISNGYIYVLSGYNNYVEAMNQIEILKKAGLKEAILLIRQKLENINQEGDLILLNNYKGVSKYIIVPLYTIQIAASKVEINLNKFSNLENIKVTKGKNNYFRYSSGNYEGYNKAKSALMEIHKIGYPNAFIKAVKQIGGIE